CALAGFHFFWRWIDSLPTPSARQDWRPNYPRNFFPSPYDLLIASLLIALSLLLKPTTVTIAVPMGALAWQRFGPRMFLQPTLWLFAVISLSPPGIWYWYAHGIAREFYPHHMFGAGGMRIMNFGWYWHIVVQTFSTTLTPVLFLLAMVGITVAGSAGASLFRWWLGAVILFVILVGYGNRHEWYRLPLVPIAAAFAGAALSTLAHGRKRLMITSTALILFGILSMFTTRQYLGRTAQSLLNLARELRERTSADALIVVADDGDPTALY